MTSDVNGREYAHVVEVSAGRILVADDGFTCIKTGALLVVESDDAGHLFVPCSHGRHYINAQLDRDGYYIGLYHTSMETPEAKLKGIAQKHQDSPFVQTVWEEVGKILDYKNHEMK